MPKSTNPSRSKERPPKPQKPYEGFPLTPHPTGRWCKRIRNNLHYFGRWDGPEGPGWEAALELYKAQRDDLHAGRTPRAPTGGLTVRDLCNRFLTAKTHLLENGEITHRTFGDYRRTCEAMGRGFGKTTLVSDLVSDDFGKLRKSSARTLGPVALGNEINRVRVVFKFGYDAGLIDQPMRYGPEFKRPSRKTLRRHRQEKQQEHGKRMFDAGELRSIIDAAGQPMKAFVLLGINAALGQSDIANLPKSAINVETGWLDYPRPKTGVERRVPLWPETLEAVREAMGARPEPRNPVDAKLAFLTPRGNRWVRTNKKGTSNDEVAKQFHKLLVKIGLKRVANEGQAATRVGTNFYSLRHGFQTVAGDTKDPDAVSAIMGHADDSMAALYREGIPNDRLRAVTDTVRMWLWPDKAPKKARRARPRPGRKNR